MQAVCAVSCERSERTCLWGPIYAETAHSIVKMTVVRAKQSYKQVKVPADPCVEVRAAERWWQMYSIQVALELSGHVSCIPELVLRCCRLLHACDQNGAFEW